MSDKAAPALHTEFHEFGFRRRVSEARAAKIVVSKESQDFSVSRCHFIAFSRDGCSFTEKHNTRRVCNAAPEHLRAEVLHIMSFNYGSSSEVPSGFKPATCLSNTFLYFLFFFLLLLLLLFYHLGCHHCSRHFKKKTPGFKKKKKKNNPEASVLLKSSAA